MLQFMIVFLGVLVSVFTENIFEDIGNVIQFTSDEKFESYIDSALQRHAFLMSFCKQNASACKSASPPDTDIFLPYSLSNGDIQKQMYNCLQVINSDTNQKLIILTAYHNSFFDSWNISSAHTSDLVYSLLNKKGLSNQINFYTNSTQFDSSLTDINSCVASHNDGSHTSLFFISQEMLRE
ncbi:hypothetical protein HG772_003903 [Salmonella enterica]|nr:hypothetical protein [Salmonella enterica]ECZ5385769.1 hypothetical protein [Salmonella enterica subsp. enterica serovar Montevideo]EBR4274552.1 hypothetical protein [Salmonella enterica]ECF6666153.1 hypothetical protein [Salmonella enterica]EFS0968979.1 hypothetical protein [Salmonella enterica]